jgi:hypothetical protein
MAYENLANLAAAYRRGDLTEPLVIDTVSTKAYVIAGSNPDWVEQVFEGGHPRALLKEALAVLGIPTVEA